MSFKKILTIVLVLSILLSLSLFAFLSQNYMHKYFGEYIDSQYDENVENIIEYGKVILVEGIQKKSFLNSYIEDPIYYVEIFNTNDKLVMNSSIMGEHIIFDEETMIVETFDVLLNGEEVGYLNITKEKNALNTATNLLFDRSLLLGAIFSALITLLFIGILLIFIIRAISKNINKVVEYATEEKAYPEKINIVEISTILNAINDYRVQLKTKERIKKKKFDKILHETKTPITVIKSQLEGINDKIITMDNERNLSMIQEINKLEYMLKDITNIFEGEIIDEIIEFEELDYSIEIEKIKKSLVTKFQNKNLDLQYIKSVFLINTNKALLNNIIYNLLINSYKYTNSGSVVIVSDNIKKTITIRDTGIGIDSKDLENVFKPYYRGKNVGNIEGEGIGLSNVKENLEKLKYSITINSQKNLYSEFTINCDKITDSEKS